MLADDEIGFLRGICEHPEDQLRKLVYADWLDEQDDPRGAFMRLLVERAALSPSKIPRKRSKLPEAASLAEIDAKLRSSRKGLDLHWRALVDHTSHFTVLFSKDRVTGAGRIVTEGEPIKEIRSFGNQHGDFIKYGVSSGDYLYPIQLTKGRIHVLSQVHINQISGTKNQYSGHSGHTLFVDESTPVRLNMEVPLAILNRLQYRDRKGKHRGLSGFQDGKLKEPNTVFGVFRLAEHSARDFAWLFLAPSVVDTLAYNLPPLDAKS